MRIAIAGYPGSGKTTLGRALAGNEGNDLRSTDTLLGAKWSELSLEVSYWFDIAGDLVVEGMAVPRALRKWLRRDVGGEEAPVDLLIWLEGLDSLDRHRRAMGAGARTVMEEIEDDLYSRGVVLVWRPPGFGPPHLRS